MIQCNLVDCYFPGENKLSHWEVQPISKKIKPFRIDVKTNNPPSKYTMIFTQYIVDGTPHYSLKDACQTLADKYSLFVKV